VLQQGVGWGKGVHSGSRENDQLVSGCCMGLIFDKSTRHNGLLGWALDHGVPLKLERTSFGGRHELRQKEIGTRVATGAPLHEGERRLKNRKDME
jgi:hypothetical protein